MPPLLLALLTLPEGFSLDPQHFYAGFHETGRAACFWIDAEPDAALAAMPPEARAEQLVTRTLLPVVEATEATGDINGKLIWSNTGYLINWYLGDLRPLLGDALVNALRQHLFSLRAFPTAAIIRCGARSSCATARWCAAPAASATACRMSSRAATAR